MFAEFRKKIPNCCIHFKQFEMFFFISDSLKCDQFRDKVAKHLI